MEFFHVEIHLLEGESSLPRPLFKKKLKYEGNLYWLFVTEGRQHLQSTFTASLLVTTVIVKKIVR